MILRRIRTKDEKAALKRLAFKTLATARVTKAVNATKAITKLTNKTNYSFTEIDAEKIISMLKSVTEDVEASFAMALSNTKEGGTTTGPAIVFD